MLYSEVHGARIPAIGFGTFRLGSEDARRMVGEALALGYRHIDTAQMYGNEAGVGQGIADAGTAREDIFLTTKVWPDRFRAGELQRSADESLKRLNSDYVDLLLLHWPNPEVDLHETLDALMEVQARGKARHIGVSNFTNALLDDAVAFCGEGVLVTNQVEYHPFLTQQSVKTRLERYGMALTAYSPLAQGRVFGNAVLKEIGEAHGKNEAQVALRWLLEQGVVAIPRTTKAANARSNFEVFDFALSASETARIDDELQGDGRVVNPSFAPQWDRP